MAVPNALNPSGFYSLGLSGGVTIFSGSSTTSATIIAEIGAQAVGSIYISTNGSGEIWVCQQADAANVWTQITIP